MKLINEINIQPTFIALSTQYYFLILKNQADVEHSGVIAVLLL